MCITKNHFKIFLIIGLMTGFNAADVFAASPIYNLCPKTRKLSAVSKPEDLVKTMCDLQKDYSGSGPIMSLTNSILKTLNGLKYKNQSNPNDWENDELLNFDLDKLSDRLNDLNSSDEIGNAQTPLQKAIVHLNDKWGDISVRSNPQNTKDYVNDFKKILSLTPTGKRVLECYEKAKGPLISGETIVEIPEEMKNNGAKMAFNIEPDENIPNKFVKKLYFNSDTSPFEAITAFAHELQHGCNSNKQAELSKALYDLPPEGFQSDDEAKKDQLLQTEKQQENAVDEMRAYRVSVEMFKDLASASPNYFCNSYMKSALLGKQVISTAEYAANIDDKFENGTYPQYIISLYASHGFYAPEKVLMKDQNGLITNKLRPDLIEKMKKEGVYVAP